ncbi:Isoleucine--tRNA ligase [Hyella patelloides LEGE 07179]|uniref:Isoleucine--tRNA ligase n=1 Tax=Hyella patelloides LEGE 07179 TaxID=945734 RepID=A0A563VUP5_9CYAN|nr:isoleucine--tRNA ligase [Hyella patelloides]VEP15160.1 Isoleucine--tRNA ligase [Hyella patelloides LEGE 07179]
MTEAKSYKETVNLPQTDFSMRANAVKREPELQQFWAENQIYEQLSQNNPKESFILHDGPPYANGSLHMGHALNKILKDIINKYKLLQGHKTDYIPGWDCHGLPIELKVLQKMKSKERQGLTPLKLRQKAQEFALKAKQEQCEGFKRYGVWGDWEHPYLTLTPEYEAAQIAVFGEMALKGYIYRGLKPVHWSPSSRTALAEAELEYPEGHTSPSIYVAFPVVSLGEGAKELEEYLPKLNVAIWTTTPWTIPGNLAVAVNGDLEYVVVRANGHSSLQYLIVAKDLVEQLSTTLEAELTIKTTVTGKTLEGITYRHPLFDRESKVVIGGDYITTESGTGLVHTAPGHGQEDYITGQKYDLPILSPVDDGGKFTEEAGKFAGLQVVAKGNEKVSAGNQAIIDALQEAGSLLKHEEYAHKYPYDWRTKKPTIFRATEQWFASVEGFRDNALEAIKSVTWIPTIGENRITPMVKDRSDWCISRQRSWGVPIPVFYDESTNEALLTEETINHVKAIIAEKGSDAWWELPVEELLPEQYRNNGKTYRKGTDTMDVWFDSGSSWASVAKARGLKYPVDMYLEGSDQHRGWFQSSLLTSVAVNDTAPYKTVLTHGYVVDANGRKMSKSLGNGVDPKVIIEGGKNKKQEPPYGADVLRLWVSSVDYSSDVRIGNSIVKQLADIYRKIRNTSRFLLGNLHDFDPSKDAVAYADLPELDKYMLHRITEVFADITDAYESYQFYRFFQAVQNFCVVDLSNFYLDIAKDRLYISSLGSFRRRSCQTVLAVAIENLAKSIAPVLSHMAEDIWQSIPYETGCKSVFQSGWVETKEEWRVRAVREQPQLWETIRNLRDEVNKVMEEARQSKAIGSSLDAKVLLYLADTELKNKLGEFNPTDSLNPKSVDELRYFFLASQVDLLDNTDAIEKETYKSTSDTVSIAIVKADGEKCERCWNYSLSVGSFADDPTICDRCNDALKGEF